MAIWIAGGVCLGYVLSLSGDAPPTIAAAIGAVVVAALAYRKGRLVSYLSSLFLALAVGLALRFIPYPDLNEIDGVVVRSGDNYVIVQSYWHRYWVTFRDNPYEIGDVIHVKGRLNDVLMTHYESRFDFASYLASLGARKELASTKATFVFQTPFRMRSFEQRYLANFDAEARSLLDSLLFGKKDYGSDVILNADSMNLLFLLSSSGLFYLTFLRLIERGFALKAGKWADVIALAFGGLFLPFSLGKIGILRVYIVRFVRALDVHVFHWELGQTDALGIAVIALLALNPYAANGSGLWLGAGISLTMALASGEVIRSPSKIVGKAKSFAVIRLFLLGNTLCDGGEIHLLSLPFALLLLPLSVLLLLFGWLGLFFVPIVPAIDALSQAISFLLRNAKEIDIGLPLPLGGALLALAYYPIYYACLYLTENGGGKARAILISASIGVYAASLLPIVPFFTESIRFIDVGQGDCALIQDGLTTVMIDTGGVTSFDIAEECLIPYLRKERIYTIDVLIASHQDYDHVGGVETLRKRFNVGRYVTEKGDFPLRVGDLTFENLNTLDNEDANASSLVLSLSFMDKKWLFTGDATKESEQAMIEGGKPLDCDVLKVGHHGSDTSTSEAFLDATTPETAVISCGLKNKFGHPKPSVLTLLERRGIVIRRTDIEGTIVFSRPKTTRTRL